MTVTSTKSPPSDKASLSNNLIKSRLGGVKGAETTVVASMKFKPTMWQRIFQGKRDVVLKRPLSDDLLFKSPFATGGSGASNSQLKKYKK